MLPVNRDSITLSARWGQTSTILIATAIWIFTSRRGHRRWDDSNVTHSSATTAMVHSPMLSLALGLGNIGKGHGVTFGDVDTDGDVDIYVSVGGAFIGDQWHNLFYQNTGPGNNWLTLKLVGVKSNRDGIGAKVTLHVGGVSNPEIRYREVSGGCGFGSTNSLQLEIGLGKHKKVDALEIVWPSGQVDTHRNLSVNRKLVVTEGESL